MTNPPEPSSATTQNPPGAMATHRRRGISGNTKRELTVLSDRQSLLTIATVAQTTRFAMCSPAGDQGIAVAIAVIEWKATIDNLASELRRRFMDCEVNHRANTVVVKQSLVSSVQRIADVQQIGMDGSDQSKRFLSWGDPKRTNAEPSPGRPG